jgi:hypothetical protein
MLRLTPRWSQRPLPLEFMNEVGHIKIIEPAEPLACQRGSGFGSKAAKGSFIL